MSRLALLLMLSTTPCWADEPGPTFGSPFHFTEVGGAAIYGAACAGCHMTDGRGAVGAGRYPALAGNERLAAAGYSITRVLRGKGAMPPFARTLSDDQIAAVVGFIGSQFGHVASAAPTAAEVAAAR